MYSNVTENANAFNNTDVNSTTSVPAAARYSSLLLSLLVVFTVVGNCLVVIAIGRYKQLRTVTNYMILSLAIADLLIGLIVMPLNISNELLQYWPYGQNLCDLWHSFDVLASTASILNLCIISLDRYWAVTEPILYPRLMSKKRGVLCISVVWVCSAVISFPSILWWRAVGPLTPGQCVFTQDTVYLLLSSMISFYIPVAVMAVVYAKIFLVIRNQSKQYTETLRVHRGGGNKIKLGNDFNLSEPLCKNVETKPASFGLYKQESSESLKKLSFSNDKEPSNLKRLVISNRKPETSLSNEYRVARMLGFVLGIFLLFWLPFFICNFLLAVCRECSPNEKVFTFVTWLGHTNSVINPVIYALSMKDMRHAFIAIITCRYDHYYDYKKSRTRKIAVAVRYRLSS